MLPDGAHKREEDWTIFFLNRPCEEIGVQNISKRTNFQILICFFKKIKSKSYLKRKEIKNLDLLLKPLFIGFQKRNQMMGGLCLIQTRKKLFSRKVESK